MKFETKVKNYVNMLADFAENRKDRSKNIIMLSMQYEKICTQWQDIVPDILLNKMLDDPNPDFECMAVNAIADCTSNERILGNVEHLLEIYDKFKDKKKLAQLLMSNEQ